MLNVFTMYYFRLKNVGHQVQNWKIILKIMKIISICKSIYISVSFKLVFRLLSKGLNNCYWQRSFAFLI